MRLGEVLSCVAGKMFRTPRASRSSKTTCLSARYTCHQSQPIGWLSSFMDMITRHHIDVGCGRDVPAYGYHVGGTAC